MSSAAARREAELQLAVATRLLAGAQQRRNVAQDRLTQAELELAERETLVLGNTIEPCRKGRQVVAVVPAPAEAVPAERVPAEAEQSPAEAEPEPEEADWV